MLKAILTGLIVLLFACSRNNNQVVLNPFQPKSVAVRGYLIPKDSLEEAKAFLAGDPRRVIVGKTDKFPENNINIYIYFSIISNDRLC